MTRNARSAASRTGMHTGSGAFDHGIISVIVAKSGSIKILGTLPLAA